MTCREVAEFLMTYLDDELGAPERDEFERHLKVCPPCVRYLKSYQQTIVLEKDACQHNAHENLTEIPDDLVKAILAARQRG